MAGVLADVVDHWYIDLSIPLVAALIGYVTKLVAIRMMFTPTEFRGIRPYLGWQGIVPRRAARMASIAVETMTRELLTAGEVLARLDADVLAREMAEPMRLATAEITRDVVEVLSPGLWDVLPRAGRELLVLRVRAETPRLVRDVLDDVRADPDAVFDLRHMVVTDLVTDKTLLNRIFREAGWKEFRFIARSGIVFGGLLGLLQLALWLAFHQPLIMPAFGLVVGWFTDWLALKLIFNPKRPIHIAGLTIQGRFLKRRREVATDYGALIAEQLITPRKVIAALLEGPMADRILWIMREHVTAAIDRTTGPARPLVRLAVGSEGYLQLKRAITARVLDQLPETMTYLEDYIRDSMDVRGLLVERMRDLDEDQFEALIRPAFEQDEWILITVGAVLGGVLGELQALVLEHVAR